MGKITAKRVLGWFFLPKLYAPNKPHNYTAKAWKRWRVVRHTIGCCIGACICVIGSYIAVKGAGSIMLDTVGYMVHGIGLMPIAAHLERFWAMVYELEPVAEAAEEIVA